jgi:diacylglycerol O-acyltransferase / wax synthase
MVTRVIAQEAASKATRKASSAAKMVQKNVERAVAGTLGISGERMTKVDTAWLRMDSPHNLMMIVGVWVLQPALAYEDLCERVQTRLLQYRRFGQRVVEDAAGATWVDDKKFDIHAHILREKLAAPKGGSLQDALQNRVALLTTTPLDRRRPLWQFHLVDNYRLADGSVGSALIMRIHHCIADGIALMSVTTSLVDGGAPLPERKKRAAQSGAEDWFTDTVLKPFTDLGVKTLGAMGDGAARSLQMLSDPQKGMAGSIDMAKLGFQLVGDLAALAMMPDDSKTRLKGKPGSTKKVAWCQPIPLEEVKAVGKALSCSINDVLLSCAVGAIGEYLKRMGDDTAGQEIRAMVPVNLRPLDQAHKLGNRFGLAPLVLPIGLDNPIERVYEVRKRMGQMKGSYQPLLAFSLLAVAGLLIKPAQDAMLNLFGKKTTAVMTNVPGPREKLQFCGTTIEEIIFWVPQSGDVGVGVSILSYGGGVQFGLITDEGLCPNPQAIIDEFEPEFAKLSIVTLMLPWMD